MLEKDFHKILKDRLTGHASEVPGDMWMRIRVKEKRRRLILFWRWYGVGALVLSLTVSGIFFLSPRPTAVANLTMPTGPVASDHPTTPAHATVSTHPTPQEIEIEPAPKEPEQIRQHTRIAGPQFRRQPISILAPPLPRSKPGLDCPLMPHRLHNLFLDIYASPDWPFTTSRRGLSYTAGLRFTKLFPSGLTASLGLQFSRINLQPPLDSLTTGARLYFYNLDLPALIGYSWGDENFRMAVNTGLIVNLHSWPEGPPSAGLRNQYQHNMGISLYIGFQAIQNLSDRYSLFAEPYFRRPLSSAPPDGSGPLRGFGIGGLSLGLRRQF